MKRLINLTVILLTLSLISCEDYSVNPPIVESVEIQEQVTNEDGSITVVFLFKCNAQEVVVWWGYDGSNYQDYSDLISNPGSNEENITKTYPRGESLQDRNDWNGINSFKKDYPASGNYELVLIATNTGDFGNDVKQTIYKKSITIQ